MMARGALGPHRFLSPVQAGLLLLTLGLFGVIVWLGLLGLPAAIESVGAETRILPDAMIEADRDTVDELLATFHRADEAVVRRDLDGVMSLYSKRYNCHGLAKSDVEQIWMALFKDYREITSSHTFSVIRVTTTPEGLLAEITCTGALWATSERGNLRVPIDSWHEEVHQLVKEDGAWRIRGNAGEAPTVLPFGTAPHPLF